MDNVFVIECKNKNLSKLRQYITNVLEQVPVDENTSFQLIMAIDELCANIIEHSKISQPDGFIKIELSKKGSCIIVKIIDKGESFNPTHYQPSDIKDLVKNRASGGLGLAIVNKFIDKIEYSVQNTLNICTLYKNLSTA
ncbi:MAG TPA: ATP-binding protein [Cytophagales bacterium]|nr:ATP-binding protein [Cytophagales bacterium]